MSYQSRRMNTFFTLNIVIILLVNIQTTQTRRCYVCGIGSDEPFIHSKSKLEYPIPLCDEFERSTDLDKFIFTCPLNYVGCITQTDGIDVTRTCDLLPIDDCQTANGVEYCYCNTDLCNKKRETSTKMKHETLYDDDDTSDIDDFESSGVSSIDTISDEKIEHSISISISTSTSTTSSAIPIIERLSPSTVPETTTATTTEAIIINKIFTTNYYSPTSASTTITTTNESIKNATNRNIVKCSKVIFIMHILMLIFL